MTWNYRKRIKIFPGVRLNVSKKGISTSFGMRGVSITNGKNGTYLNTSIPGTGIYNRKKLSGRNANSKYTQCNNSNMSNNNGGSIVFILLVITYLLLSFLVLTLWTANITLGIIFTTLVVGVKIIQWSKNKKKQENFVDTRTIEEPIDTGSQIHTTSIDNKSAISYFNTVSSEVEKIVTLFDQLLQDDNFINHFKERNHLKIVINDKDPDIKTQVKVIFLLDMTRSFIELGHDLRFGNRESFGLFYFFYRTYTSDKIDFERFSNLIRDGKFFHSVESIVQQLKTLVSTNPSIVEVFWISKILGGYDSDLQKKYLVMLYRYTSLMAKADGIVTDQEAKWLSEILNLSNDIETEGDVVISNSLSIDKISSTVQPKDTFMVTPKPIKTPLTKLKALIGLDSVKAEIETLTNFVKIQQHRESKGLKTPSVSYHCVFTGNPGTGKTTVARIVAEIYKSLGILSKGHLVETDRSGLVAEYVGQTAVKTNKIIDKALDGVLFIDEAYSLISDSQNDYGKEAIATLLKRMEDDRNRLVVILAGYSTEMKLFIDSNPGLQSRFNRYIEFPDYSAEELYKIFEKNVKACDYRISKETEMPLKEFLANKVAHKDKNFGNARFVRNLFEKTIEKQANRLSKKVDLTDEKLSEICAEDLPL